MGVGFGFGGVAHGDRGAGVLLFSAFARCAPSLVSLGLAGFDVLRPWQLVCAGAGGVLPSAPLCEF